MHPRIALLLYHLLLVIALETPLLKASSAQNRLDAGPPESSIHEPLPEDTVRICPLPWCKRCPTPEEIRAPGIGFSLEMGYGTASIRYHDGTYLDVAYIAGNNNYIDLLRRLASGSSRVLPYDLSTYRGKLLWAKERTQRLLRKKLSRPATPTTAVLTDMISELKSQVESVLRDGRKVTAAVLSSPDQVSLSAEEITDALEHLGVRNLMADPDTLEDLHASSAAYAGLGMGLCERYTDPYICEREDNQIYPSTRLLHLDFSPESLCATVRWIKSAKESRVDESIVDHGLGLGKNHVLDAAYWDAVRNRIRRLAQSFGLRITQVILTGSSACDQRFKVAVKEALRDWTTVSALDMLDQQCHSGEPSMLFYATARGAAEFAKRRQEGPVRCAETERCKEIRQGIERENLTNKPEL